MTPTLTEVINITADAVARKQDAAKLNFPVILDKIKEAAKRAESKCLIPISQMNEWDKNLLTTEGFKVALVDKVKDRAYESNLAQYIPGDAKEWKIEW